MSEYQYYEFQAIDRPLTKTEQAELRAYSTRAEINARHFKNEYHWGDLKASPLEWMKRYFDAHLYSSNFGSRAVYLRLPLACLDAAAIKPYLVKGALELTKTSDHFILAISGYDEPEFTDDGEEDGDTLNAILPIRDDLACGDHRALYLGWLRGVQSCDVADEALEPPVPPGLADLDDAHQAFADFLQIDPDLLAAAAQASPAPPGKTAVSTAAPAWLTTLTPKEKDQWLLRLLTDTEGGASTAFRQAFQRSLPAPMVQNTAPSRTAGSLLEAMVQAADLRRAAERQKRNAALLAKQKEAAADRLIHLESLKGQEENLWKSIHALTATTVSQNYASAVVQLTDLRDLAQLTNTTQDFTSRFTELKERCQRKPALLERFKTAGL